MKMTFNKFLLGLFVLTFGGVALAADLTTTQKTRMLLEAFPETELNTEIAARLDAVDSVGESASVTVGAEYVAENFIVVRYQFKDERGVNLTVPFVSFCYLSDLSTGIDLAGTAGTSAFTATDGSMILVSQTTGLAAEFVTAANGKLGIRVTQTAAIAAQYMVCTNAFGKLVVSSAVDFD